MLQRNGCQKSEVCFNCFDCWDLVKVFLSILLQVPYEILNKRFRNAQKIIDREVAHLATQLNDLTSATSNESLTVESASKCLGEVVEKLECLKRKVLRFFKFWLLDYFLE